MNWPLMWSALGVLGGLIVAGLGGLNTWWTLQTKLSIAQSDEKRASELNELKLELGRSSAELRLELTKTRSEDRDWLRDWAESEFARTGTVNARIDALQAKVERLENRRRSELPPRAA